MFVFRASALLFDCDGVLVDSHDAAAVAWNAWGRKWKPGFDFHRDVEHGRRLADFVAALVGPADAAHAVAELSELELRHAVDVREVAGAAALVATLPADRWAVVTSGSREIAVARLSAAGIPLPAVLITADDVTAGKPSPDPYLLAAARLGRSPQECAVLEDAPAGVTAARRAGVRTVIGVGDNLGTADITASAPDLRGIGFDGTHLILGESHAAPHQ